MNQSLDFAGKTRVPLVQQAEVAECGHACLAMIAGFHEAPVGMPELRRRFPPSARGMTLTDIMRVATEIGFSKRAVRVEIDDLGALRLPAVLHWDFNHFVVLEEISQHGFTIADPARGRMKVERQEIAKRFTGVALEIVPASRFDPTPGDSIDVEVGVLDLVGDLRPFAGVIVRILMMTLALQALVLITPWLLQAVIDHVLIPRDIDLLIVLGLTFGFFSIYRALLTGFRSWAINHLTVHLSARVLERVYASVLALPVGYFMRRHVADIFSRFQSADVIHRTVSTGFVEGIVDGLLSMTVLAVMFLYSPQLACISLAFCILYVCFRLMLAPVLKTASQRRIESLARRDSEFLESTRGIRTIRCLNAEIARHERFNDRQIDYLNHSTRVVKLESLFQGGNALIFGVDHVLIVALGTLAILDGTLSLGMLIAFLAYKTILSERVAKITELLIEFRMLGLHVERVSDIVTATPEIALKKPPRELEAIEVLRLENLGFRYAKHEPWIFRELTFEIPVGLATAITGPSGCGKSTLLKVLTGLLQPVEGEIFLDGLLLTVEHLRSLRAVSGIVMQDDRLFFGTIADNISGFDSFPDQTRIEVAAQQAAIHDDIVKMPMRYETPVGDMGDSLSGGQRQRVMVARALYRNPKILFFDEATSHLDIATETTVNAVLKSMKITRVAVAHRQSIIENADHIIKLG